MGKRTSYPRRDRDAYFTPPSAVLPLVDHLEPGVRFIEPMAGDGAIIRALEGFAVCIAAFDITPQSEGIGIGDAMELDAVTVAHIRADLFITNTPYPRGGSNGEPTITMIEHLSGILPTWCLLPHDFFANRYFARLSARCVRIVPIGRVSWMGNGKAGTENSAWSLFAAGHSGPTEYCPRLPACRSATAASHSQTSKSTRKLREGNV